ncbi:MAG: NAD(P)/FAD-dependent oxidoreductase [Flavobacteriales bacterium]
MSPEEKYDVIILGGGLAGLTLSLQLKKKDPDISVLLLEKRAEAAPIAAHKVGESTVELGTYYLREMLELKSYLDQHQLPKQGLRFFFSPAHKEDIANRVELGPRAPLTPVKSHQLDRGALENDLEEKASEAGVDISLGNRVKEVKLNKGDHRVAVRKNKEDHSYRAKWVVDATGRSEFLKRKLKLQKPMDHHINAAWFRVKGEVDVDDWSENKDWKEHLKPGLRRLSTVHLMDKGYWVWLIPLGTGHTSVGIVADPRVHPFENFNKLDKAFDWLSRNEPLAYRALGPKKDEVLDFRVLKDFSHHSQKVYSEEGWALAGEAGPFLDPLYSPGTDFIAINNTLITELIQKDLEGESIEFYADVFERTFLSVVDSWIPIYQDKYLLMGNTQTMVAKIFWDWALYWSFTTLLFTNNGFSNLMVLKELFASEDGLGRRIHRLNEQTQQMFIDFAEHDHADLVSTYVDPFDLRLLKDLYNELDVQYRTRDLLQKLKENTALLEHLAAELYRRFSSRVHGTPADLQVNPYEMDLKKGLPYSDEEDAPDLLLGQKDEIRRDVDALWLYGKQKPGKNEAVPA